MFRRASLLLFAVPSAAQALAGCGGNASHALPTTNSGRPATLGVASNGLGQVLVDRQGRTLYLFARDSGTISTCTGTDGADSPRRAPRPSRKPHLCNCAASSLTTTHPSSTPRV